MRRRRDLTLARITATALLLLAGTSLPLDAQQTGEPPAVLSLPASVRQASMAGAGAALIGDAGSVFSNPAGLATIKVLSIEGSFQYYPDNTLQGSASAALRVGPFNLGGGGSYIVFNDSARTASNLMWVGSAVYRYGLIAIGASGKYVSSEDTTGRISRAVTTDAGIAIAVFDIAALGFSVQNIGENRISGDPLVLPTRYRLGFMMNFTDPQTTARLLGTIETIWTQDQERRTIFGFEVGAIVSGVGIVGRIGYGGQPTASHQAKTTYGGGILLGRLGLDYAYQRRSGLGGEVHRVGIRWTP
ncbi:MAG: hypothetical protein ABI679_13055 [Gemmatimonadota bacterium]